MSKFQQKIKTCKKNRKLWSLSRKRKQATESVFDRIQISNLVNKDFKTAIINTFKELKETIFK